MASTSRNSGSFPGYRSWFKPFRYSQRIKTAIFVLDFESDSKWEENQSTEYYDLEGVGKASVRINGIQIFFLDEDHVKRKAFLRHAPYFYLLVADGLPSSDLVRIQNVIRHQGGKKVIRVEITRSYDARDLTFLKRKPFIRVTVDHPGSVPSLRERLEHIDGIIEWREADVLFHHRVAIDHGIRVGSWFNAEIDGGEIISLISIPNKAPPELRLIAFDIETTFEPTRDPNPEIDVISMISLFTGDSKRTGNLLLVNSQVVDSSQIGNFDILLRDKNDEYPNPWVDWIPENSVNSPSDVLERFPIQVLTIDTEADLLRVFFQFIKDYQPDVLTDFFGGRFDIPFISVRAKKYRQSLQKETGFQIVLKNQYDKERAVKKGRQTSKRYTPSQIDHVVGAGIIHLDAFDWTERYSYLPKKDLGLKQSVNKKLKIIPIGKEALFGKDIVEAAAYAASDGYITWKYVREIILGFFITMGKMFPVSASELLSRRAGSLDDLLIDAEDYKHGIIGGRRISQKNITTFSPNINIESLAFTGGLVEARRPGVFRSDIFYDFTPNKGNLKDLKQLIRDIIHTESNLVLRKAAYTRFKAFVSTELDGLDVTYSDNHENCLLEVKRALTKDSVKKEDISKKFRATKEVLDEIEVFQVLNLEEVIQTTLEKIDHIIESQGKTQLRGLHVDVTSMYPAQIRQYKLQPSGIVSTTRCSTCNLYEENKSCYFEGDWVIKLTGHRPCRHLLRDSIKCDPSICTSQNAINCKDYEPQQTSRLRFQEVYSFNGEKTQVHRLVNKSHLKQIPLNQSYLGSTLTDDPFHLVQMWLKKSVDATQLTKTLDQSQIDLFEEQPSDLQLPIDTYLSLDVRTKNLTVFLSVRSRVCQKAYNFLARIMDDFFNTRLSHKNQAQQLKQLITQQQENNQPVSAELLRLQKFHDSTQLGMKVPLNSIYGLLGMKGGVRNASTPCAGITTKLSADLIRWAADQLEQIGWVTELDTDGVWFWVPKAFPIDFPVTVDMGSSNEIETYQVTLIDKILNVKVQDSGFINKNYWLNDGSDIRQMTKSLIKFEQDGGYDFQFVMGKKKYIVYNYLENNPRTKWVEEELTGLESKRADFSKLQKYFQERIIQSYLDKYDPKNPITLIKLYKQAIKTSENIRAEITTGKMDLSYFIKPKAINKPLDSYKSALPQVTCARILQDLNYDVGPGTRVQMLNIKGNHVLPSQIFDLEFDVIKKVLIKHGIGTLSFMLGELKTKEDLRKLIDLPLYIDDIFGPGRIHDRMVKYPMIAQNIPLMKQQELETEYKFPLTSRKKAVPTTVARERFIQAPKTNISPGQKNKRRPKASIRKPQKTKAPHEIPKVRSLDAIFGIPQQRPSRTNLKKTAKKRTSAKSKSKKQLNLNKNSFDNSERDTEAFSEWALSTNSSSRKQEKIQPSAQQIEVKKVVTVNEAEVVINGDLESNSPNQVEPEMSEDENIFCSECGSIISPQELSEEGCSICGGQKLFFED